MNWNLADNVFGAVAYRVNYGDWIHLGYANYSAFAVLGSPVPEPGALGLACLGVLALLRRR